MSPAPISRRGVVVGGAAVLAAVVLPVGVVELAAAEVLSTARFEALPPVFDSAAFVEDLLSTGHHLSLQQPVRWSKDPDEDLRPYYFVHPRPGGGFNRAYGEVMARWADRPDGTPDHVGRVVAHLRERVEGGNEAAERFVRQVAVFGADAS